MTEFYSCHKLINKIFKSSYGFGPDDWLESETRLSSIRCPILEWPIDKYTKDLEPCGFMVGALASRSNGPGSIPDRGHCVVFLGKTLYSRSVSLNPGV